MLDAPSIVCRVLGSTDTLIESCPGDLLVIWPGHPTHTVTVCGPDGLTVRAFGYCAEAVLYGALLNLYLDAAIRCCDPESERSLLTAA
ncbi:hypothetical protein [Gemmatimonas sp.]|uniref:hypothetical protein n=1 Tax=Gemmatimonas sp. TaxID=1962908 RepID=UPI00334110C1